MSDSNQDDLDPEALKAIFGSDILDDSPPIKEKKKKAPSKKTNNAKSKKNSKQKKAPINLDALMDGIDFDSATNNDINNDDLNEINYSNFAKEDKPKKQNIKIFNNDIFDPQPVDVFASLENRINKYLENTLQAMHSDLIKEIEQILIENDSFDDTVINFIEKLNHSIYETISYEASETTRIQNTFYNVFDDFSGQFLSSFRKIGEFTSQSNSQSINIIRSCRSLVKAKHPILERQMNNAIHDINQEISDLNSSRSRDSSLENENRKKMRNYFHQYVFLEGKMKALDEITDSVLKKLEKIQEIKSRLFSPVNQKLPDNDIFLRHLRNASHYLKTEYLPKKIKNSKLFKTKSDKIFFACEDLMASVSRAESSLDIIKNSYTDIPVLQQNTNKVVLNKSKIVEETRNNLIQNKTQREAQIEEVNEMLIRMRDRGKEQIDE